LILALEIILFGYETKSIWSKSKNIQVRLHQTKKVSRKQRGYSKIKRGLKTERYLWAIPGKGLVSKICKEYTQLNSTKTKQKNK
jgi:hypothetical protein